MFDSVPTRVWLLLCIAIAAAAPLRYVIRHIGHDPRRRDITLPPEDLEWRSSRRLIRCLAFLAAFAALAAFILTPAAERFARSPSFWPVLMIAIGLFAAGSAVLGFFDGRIGPLVRGSWTTYERTTQPGRFWASLAWNATVGLACIVGGFASVHRWQDDDCFVLDGAETPRAKVAACSAFLAATDSPERRADALAERGRTYHGFGDYQWALADYTQALRLDPQNGNVRLNRGLVFLDTGRHDQAISDFTLAHQLDPDDPTPLANRALVHAWANEAAPARADFAAARALDPTNQTVLHGEAVLAMESGDSVAAIERLTQALRQDPQDEWALRLRGDIYWRSGERDKARADDDRLGDLLDELKATATKAS